jgi:hypothetical protein
MALETCQLLCSVSPPSPLSTLNECDVCQGAHGTSPSHSKVVGYFPPHLFLCNVILLWLPLPCRHRHHLREGDPKVDREQLLRAVAVSQATAPRFHLHLPAVQWRDLSARPLRDVSQGRGERRREDQDQFLRARLTKERESFKKFLCATICQTPPPCDRQQEEGE